MTPRDIEALRDELRRHDIGIALDGDRLAVEYPIDEVPEDVLGRLVAWERELVAALRQDEMPLSFAQQRLWIIDRLEGGSAHYNLPVALRLRGAIDVDAIGAAFGGLFARHEVLRTRFVDVDGQARLDIHPASRLELLVFDVPAGPPSERDAWVSERIAEEASRPFDLAHDDMMRVRMLRLADDDAVLLVTLHHIAGDAWSVGILIREFQALYAAHSGGATASLPAPGPGYVTHARRQRGLLAGEEGERLLAFWREQLTDLPAVHALPTDRARPDRSSFVGDVFLDTFDQDLTSRLNAFASSRRTTLFVLLKATFAALLHRLSSQDDIALGVPVAGRTEVDVESAVGFFVNTVVLRSRVDPDEAFDAFLARTHTNAMDAMAHATLPFEWLVDRLAPPRSRAFSPLFQIMFSLHPAEIAKARLPNLSLERLDTGFRGVKCDLELEIAESVDGLSLRWAYATSLFDAPRIARMAAQYRLALEAILADPGLSLGELPILTADDAARLDAWNDTETTFPGDPSLLTLFERTARATPEAVAVLYDEGSLSYARLDAWSNAIAAYLRQTHGVRAGSRVGHCMGRSPAMLACLLGIMKAGGAYVALDAAQPDDRLRYMIQDSDATVVLADAEMLVRLQGSVPVVDASNLGEHTVAVTPPTEAVTADATSYVIYTSGSTGLPKGTLNTHRAVCNRIRAMQAQFDLGPDDRVMHKTPLGFDVSVWEMFWPWMVGAAVVLAAPQGHRDPLYIETAVRRHGVTVLHFVPSMLQMFLRATEPGRLDSLRYVMASGEAISRELQEESIRAFPGVRLINHYGPTETAIEVSWWPFDAVRPDGIVPIGRPIANVRLYVLDDQGRQQPIGVPGELHIGGIQVGQGYLNKPDLTQERFVVRAPRGEPERLYRTGDRARWLEDGQIQYLGRLDHQVKLRGVRIELGDIESRLRAHPQVVDAVAAVSGTLADQVLACYVVIASDVASRADVVHGLKRFMEEGLPAYARQCRFVLLDHLPLSPNGKVDRQALPAPETMAPVLAVKVATVGGTERALQSIWAEVLGMPAESLGSTDNFFETGGNSLRAIALQVAIRKTIGKDIAIADLFQYPSIAEQARRLDAREEHPREERRNTTTAAKQRILQARSRRVS